MAATTQAKPSKLEYFIGKSLDGTVRFAIGAGCILLGLAIQFALPWVFGAVLIVAGGLVLAPRGLDNTPSLPAGSGDWKEVTDGEMRRVLNLSDRCRSWGASFLSASCGRGLLLALGVGLVAVIGYFALSPRALRLNAFGFFNGSFLGTARENLGRAFVLDVVLLVVPLWVSGWVSRHFANELVIKVKALQNIVLRLNKFPADGWVIERMLEMRPCKKGSIPVDARLMVKNPSGPSDFMGIQVQVSINNVQGKKYPYLYTVVLAKEGFGLDRVDYEEPAKVVIEFEKPDDVEVAVVRQFTTRQSGYHTKPKDMVRVFETALDFSIQSITAHGSD